MSLLNEFDYAAGVGPQLPTTPMGQPQAREPPALERASVHTSRDINGSTRRKLTDDRWLTSTTDVIGRVCSIVSIGMERRRVVLDHGRSRTMTEVVDNEGRCESTNQKLKVVEWWSL